MAASETDNIKPVLPLRSILYQTYLLLLFFFFILCTDYYFVHTVCATLVGCNLWGFHRYNNSLFSQYIQYKPNVFINYCLSILLNGARGGAVDRGTALQAGRSRVWFPRVSLEFFIDVIFPAVLWSWGRLSLLQKGVPGILPGGKSCQCVGLTSLPPSCADCLEIWEPQPPGTLRACPGL